MAGIKHIACASTLGVFLLLLGSCRGYPSSDPPVRLNRNMFIQEKGKAYRQSDFFDNGQYMRMPIEGTVAVGQLKEDEFFYFGTVDDKEAKTLPKELTIDDAFLKRGQRVFNRVCAACHAEIGDGNGLVGRRLLVKPTSLHSEYMYDMPPGHYFNVMSNGIRTMQSLEHMIGEKDRWAVTVYIRSLQMSQDMDGAWIKRSAQWWTQK